MSSTPSSISEAPESERQPRGQDMTGPAGPGHGTGRCRPQTGHDHQSTRQHRHDDGLGDAEVDGRAERQEGDAGV